MTDKEIMDLLNSTSPLNAARTIYPDQLTNAEGEAIAVQYSPYENHLEFWFGFIDHQNRRPCPYGEDSVAGQSWGRGVEAAMWVLHGRRSR